jgi:hypothetical protein
LCAFTLNGNGNDNFIDWFACYFFKHLCICRSLHKIIFNV